MKIAFFGLGNMGFPVAANLLKAGHEVTSAAHRSKERLQKLTALGGTAAASNEDAVRDADIIFTIVPNDASLKELMQKESMRDAVKDGVIIIDMTSASANAVQELAAYYAPKHARVLDAPVSGGTVGAANGTMTMMCSGDRALFDEVLPVLSHISGKQYYCGATPGLGKMIKSINNLMASANLAMACEAKKIMEKNGIDPEVFFDVVSASSGNSFSFGTRFREIVKGDYTPHFSTALMKKDVGLAMQLTEGLSVPISDITMKYYEAADAAYSDEDYCSIAKIDL